MSVAQPSFLMVMNESSGTAITNYGTVSGGYAITADSPPASGYTWNPGTPPAAYIDITSSSSGTMPRASTSATTPGTTFNTINFAAKFRVESMPDSEHGLIARSSGYGIEVYAQSPSGSGDFDLFMHLQGPFNDIIVNETNSAQFGALSLGVDYSLAFSMDVSNASAVQLLAKLGANTTYAPATQNWSGNQWSDAWPELFRTINYTNARGWPGRVYYLAYQRGGTAWSSSDLASINSNPAGTITGWPGGGGGGNVNLFAGKFGGLFAGKMG